MVCPWVHCVSRLVFCTTSCWRPRRARCRSVSLPWTTPPQMLGRWWAASLCSTTGTCVGVKEGWDPVGKREPQRSTGQAFVGPSLPPSFCWVFPSTTDDRAPPPPPSRSLVEQCPSGEDHHGAVRDYLWLGVPEGRERRGVIPAVGRGALYLPTYAPSWSPSPHMFVASSTGIGTSQCLVGQQDACRTHPS